jgi:ATP diphosphatase
MENTQKLLEIMARLRHPEKGCSWDLQQNFSSLIPYTIEEAYEVADAIERNDLDDLQSELGDLLLQVVFHSRLAEEQGLFDFEQVSESICQKLIRRHPHVFSGKIFSNDEERKQAWEAEKALERKNRASENNQSVLDGIAINLPALMQCEKTLSRAAIHGFDWPETSPVFAKVREELSEVEEAWESGDQAHIQEEIGDLLLVVVNLARHLKVNPEIALKEGNKKFSRRFHYIEQKVSESDRELRGCKLEELDAYWDEAKIVLKKY